MKNLVVRIFLLISLGANMLFANPVNDFVNTVASGIFSTAWPTAKYKDVEIVENQKTSSGYDIVLKFNGNSSGFVCMSGNCPLWFTLNIQTDSDFSITDMKVLEYNSIIAKPFQTSGSIAKAIINANSK